VKVHVRLFAALRDVVGASSIWIDLPHGALAEELVDELARRHPRFAPYREHTMIAVQGTFLQEDAKLHEGDEVALMPPVSGGSVTTGPFSLDELVASVERRGAGAVVAFVGLVRETSGERPGERVERLHFEAFAPLADRAIQEIEQEAVSTFGLTGVVVAHRVETLAVGEPIVAVVAASAHRAAAFEATAWIMDALKARVPIWKQEDGPGGRVWVNDPTRRKMEAAENGGDHHAR
jgi:molybdopterin synthase catalytic subunit